MRKLSRGCGRKWIGRSWGSENNGSLQALGAFGMTLFVPLSRRSTGQTADGPFEGVPSHMRAQLARWYVELSWTGGDATAQETIASLYVSPFGPQWRLVG